MKRKAAAAPHRGRHEMPDDQRVGQTVFQFRLAREEKAKLKRLGGSTFLRACIDAAPEPK